MRNFMILAAVLLATASFAADAQQRYRWTDDNGSTRISDRIPPSASDKRIEVLNARGMVVRVIEPKRELSAEEQAADEAADEAARRDRLAVEERSRRDRMLLDSYTSIDDLTRSRDTRVSALEAQIAVSRDAAAAHAANLAELEKQADGHRDAGRPVPDKLAGELADTRQQLESMQEFVATREAEQEKIVSQFEADIERFRDLRGSGSRD